MSMEVKEDIFEELVLRSVILILGLDLLLFLWGSRIFPFIFSHFLL